MAVSLQKVKRNAFLAIVPQRDRMILWYHQTTPPSPEYTIPSHLVLAALSSLEVLSPSSGQIILKAC